MGWVNTWANLGGGVGGEVVVTIGFSSDTGNPDTADPTDTGRPTLTGQFMGGVCRCGAVPLGGMFWPMLVVFIARRRRVSD